LGFSFEVNLANFLSRLSGYSHKNQNILQVNRIIPIGAKT
jgi:hypothetical protein